VRYLRGVEPPSWSALAPPPTDLGAAVSVLDEDTLPWVAAEDWRELGSGLEWQVSSRLTPGSR